MRSFSPASSDRRFSVTELHPSAGACSRLFTVRAGLFPVRSWFATASKAFLFLLCMVLVPALACAEILIAPQIGFRGVFQLGQPFPLNVELTNSGRPVEGILTVRVWKGGAAKGGIPYPLEHRRDMYLAAQSRRNLQFTVDPDFVSRPLTITFSTASGQVSREVDLRRYFSPAAVILFASDGRTIPALSLGPASTNRLVSLALAELPSDGRALLGVSHLILYDPSLRELSRAQLRALDTWLTSGGRMLILGSLNYALYQEPALSRFLPVRVTGVKRMAFVSPLDGDRPLPAAQVWAQTSTAVRGRILAETDGVPILVEMSRGKGRITYLSLDVGRPPLSQWDGLPKLLRHLLAPPVADDPPPRTRWDDSIFTQLVMSPSFISSYVPTGPLFFAMIGYLGGIGLFAWLWHYRRVQSYRVALAFLGFVVVAASGGYLFFSRGGNIPDGVLLSATVLEKSMDGYVEAQSGVALFSTQTRHYSVRLKNGWLQWVPVSNPVKNTPGAAVMAENGGDFSRFQLPLREWDYRLFRLRFIDRFPLSAEFEQQGDKLLMTINNRSAKDLLGCWLVLPGERYDLGDIPRGASWTREFSFAARVHDRGGFGRAESLDFRGLPFKDKTHEILFHSSMFPRDEGRWSRGAAVFFGWVEDPERWVSVEDERLRAYDYTLFRAIIPLETAEEE